MIFVNAEEGIERYDEDQNQINELAFDLINGEKEDKMFDFMSIVQDDDILDGLGLKDPK